MGQFEKGSQHGDFNGDGAIDLAYVSSAGVTVVMNANDSAANLAGAVGFKLTAPASTTSGSALPMTVTAVDAAGNPATGFLGTVFITTNDPAVTSTFAYTFTAADAGTHSFTGSVRLVTPGDQTVTVASPLMTSATTTVNVTPAVSKLDDRRPDRHDRGRHLQRDGDRDRPAGRRREPGTRARFTSRARTCRPGCPPTTPSPAADAGVHTFTVTLKTAGSEFLSATEVGGTVTGGAFVNVAPAAASGLTLAGSGGSIGVARPITIVARDTYGNFVTGYNGTVHFTSSDPSAVLPADTTLVNGAATVNVTFMTVGTQTITATDVATPAITGTMSSDATPPVAALFAVAGFPATTAGVAQTFTVTVRDTIGQIATGYTGTVFFSSSDVQAGLPASYTFTAADAGVHTFTATLRTAGTQSITVRDFTRRPVRLAGGNQRQPGGFRRLPALGPHRDRQPRPLPHDGGRPHSLDREGDGYLRQRRHRLHRHRAFQQHRHPGRPARRLHVHRGGRRRAHLHGRPEDGDTQWRRLVVQRGRYRERRHAGDDHELRGGECGGIDVRHHPSDADHRRRRVLVQGDRERRLRERGEELLRHGPLQHLGRERRASRGLHVQRRRRGRP